MQAFAPSSGSGTPDGPSWATTLDTTTAPTTATLAELARCVRILGAPVPTVWCLNEEASLSGQWPTITPLGTSHGDMHHLLLDTQGLEALDDAERRFLMGSALGHLQCDHGIMFTTCLLARGPDAPRWTRALRQGLQPAMKLMCFSADRAGLLCSESLDAAMEGMRHHVAESRSAGTQWMPMPSSYDLRVTSLREFHQSDVYARVRGARAARHRDSPWIRHQAPLAPTTSLTTPGPSLASTSASPEDSGSFDTMKASATPADPLAASIAELGARVSKAARALGLDDIAARVDADLTRRMGDGRLRVAIIGEIKHGKSSLINALAGADVLPTGVTPTTGALVSVRAGDEDVRRLARHDGSSSALSHDRFASLARGTRDDEEANPGHAHRRAARSTDSSGD